MVRLPPDTDENNRPEPWSAPYLDGVRGWSLGENLAWRSGAAATPAHIVEAWMRSPGHRRNILDGGFREIGVGLATGAPRRTGGGGATYVNELGHRTGR